MKLAALLIVLTLVRLLGVGQMELTPDEAYYHEWSKRLDLCYFSKGPGIALTMRASTELFGHSEFGVRAFAPLLALGSSLLLFWLARRIYNERVAFWAVVLMNVTPLFNAGGLVMTIDPLSIFFWLATLCTLWLALEHAHAADAKSAPVSGTPEASRPVSSFSWWWPISGLLIGAGFLCKWTNAFLLLSVLLLLALTPRCRRELRRPGFWSMILCFLPALIPVWLWQSERGWPILNHLATRGGLEKAWYHLELLDFGKFIATHFLAYSPLIFFGMVVALWSETRESFTRWVRALFSAIPSVPRGFARHWGGVLFVLLLALSLFFAGNFWEVSALHKAAKVVIALAIFYGVHRCKEAVNVHWKSRFLAAFAVPIILIYLWIALHHDSEVNWTAPGFVTVFILGAAHYLECAPRLLTRWAFGIAIAMSVVGSQPDIVRAVGISWPSKADYTTRLRGWRETAKAVADFRADVEKQLGRPVFLIAENYGFAGSLCFYLPERQPEAPGHPLVYVEQAVVAGNQFNFWPSYDTIEQRGPSVTINDQEDSLEYGVSPFAGRTAIYVTTRAESKPPTILMKTFRPNNSDESEENDDDWKPVKTVKIMENGRVLREIRFFICYRYNSWKVLD